MRGRNAFLYVNRKTIVRSKVQVLTKAGVEHDSTCTSIEFAGKILEAGVNSIGGFGEESRAGLKRGTRSNSMTT